MNLRSSKDSGFTLVEVLIAISILATIAVVISSSWGGNLIRFKTSQIKTEAVELLQKKIIEIESEYKNRVNSLPKEKQSGTFEEDRYKKYKWEWEVQDIAIPDIAAMLDTENEDPMVISVLQSFRTYINQSIKEVKVVLTYQNGKERPHIFTVPFYMVNFDNQFSMGIPGMDNGGQSPLGGDPSNNGTTGSGGGGNQGVGR